MCEVGTLRVRTGGVTTVRFLIRIFETVVNFTLITVIIFAITIIITIIINIVPLMVKTNLRQRPGATRTAVSAARWLALPYIFCIT